MTFTRIAGPVLGTIANEIVGGPDDLDPWPSASASLWSWTESPAGPPKSRQYADSMTGDYLKAVAATLNAMRRLASEPVVPA